MSTAAPTRPPRVVVGVDGTPESSQALRWAARWAGDLGGEVRLVSAVDRCPASVDAVRRHRVQARAVRHVAQLAEAFPDLNVTVDVVSGSPVRALVAASRGSDAVVVGTRALDGLRGVFSGSVAGDVSAHAHCVVVVVPPGVVADGAAQRADGAAARADGAAEPTDGAAARANGAAEPTDGATPVPAAVVVGVDGSPESAEAAEFACAEATRRGCGLLAVTVHPEVDPPAAPLSVIAAERRALRDGAAAELARVVDPLRAEWPHLPVECAVLGGEPATELGRLSQGMPLVVVGSRGRGGFAGLLLGSTSRELLSSARCPVAVVRSNTTE